MLRPKRPPKPLKPWTGPKPKLTMGITLRCRVHYLNLEKYLARVYKMRDYSIQKATGAIEGCSPEYTVTGQMPSASNAQQQTDSIRRGQRTRRLGLILDVLCADGFIPQGKYVIDMTKKPDPINAYTKLLNKHHDPAHPECIAFRTQHKTDSFCRRAAVLDNLVREFKQKLEKPDE